jgi:phosphohistidine phosphatase
MTKLILLRHAKAVRDDPGGDHARGLTQRGRQDARNVGLWLREHALNPDIALVSDARRTRETMEELLPHFARPPHARVDAKLYLADPRILLKALRAIPHQARNALLVAHNPGIAALANALAGAGEPHDLAQMAHSFPTASFAILDFQKDWRDIGELDGRLERFIKARDLREV